MPETLMWVEVEEGATLSRSRTKPGSFSPLTRDSDRKLGHATLREPEPGEIPFSAYSSPVCDHIDGDRERDRAQDVIELVEMLIRLGIFVYEESPRFRAWWHANVSPRLVAARTRLSAVRRGARTGTAKGSGARPETWPILELEGVRPTVNADVAGARLEAALRAEEITERELRLLRGLRFYDRDPRLTGREFGGGALLHIGGAIPAATGGSVPGDASGE